MFQGMSEQVKDFSWEDEEIREKSVVKYRKEMDGERRERGKWHILGK